ncbi:L-lactate permease [Spirochaeta africana]|uniref:L-lactate permease n=1 Tax=Spirochaeta africana (strain ATCC 700263 / DSM 8902 / Z-7692) TaxID=889378 RepID=H9UJH0_SPIAZ|nr:L-lactate permease [Spirochaeta africana]AFG37663.1 L-lactate transport [Spirochaeta africana DSM 8902]
MTLHIILSFLPIALLIYLMTKRNSTPSHIALPLTALATYLLGLTVFQHDPNLLHAAVLDGLLTAWTPILVIWGAIFLFRTMEATGSMHTIRSWLNTVTPNKIAQLMIVGWAFIFLIEGASGFGTPAALAAPILVGLGFPPLRVAIMALIMNAASVSFGAVGTPTWFGFAAIELTQAEILEIGVKSAVIHGAASLIIPLIALSFLVKWRHIRRNLGFIYLSIAATIIPYIGISMVNYEFPALIGGAIGLLLSVVFAKLGWGLDKNEGHLLDTLHEHHTPNIQEISRTRLAESESLIKATFPLWGTILVLLLTRIPQLGLHPLLNLSQPAAALSLGSLGTFTITPSLTISLQDIFGTPTSWSHRLLYVPSLIPFALISLLTFIWYRSSRRSISSVFRASTDQMRNPAKALLGALVFVNLMMHGGDTAPVVIIGETLARITGVAWQYFSALLGALGSFFSGSNTISNLTFGPIQDSIAADTGLNRTTIMALQSVGGAMGAMISINNIVAVCSVLALQNSEGYILKRTARALVVYAIIAAAMSLLMT